MGCHRSAAHNCEALYLERQGLFEQYQAFCGYQPKHLDQLLGKQVSCPILLICLLKP